MKKAIIWIILVVAVAALVGGAVWYFTQDKGEYISKDEAKAAALADAGVTASEVKKLKVDREHDDGYTYYEVTFTYEAVEYEYAIDATTGKVVHVEKESVFD